MILLAATTDKLQVISSAAATLDVHVSYMELSSSTFAVNGGGKQNTAISTAATTDVLAAPGATTYRNAKTINIRNKDATVPCTVTVQYNQNATLFELHKALIQPGEALEYIEGIGFFVLTNNTTSRIMKVLTADDTGGANTATAQPWFPTTGTVAVPGATTFRMRGQLYLTTGATTHTTALSFAGSATLTSIEYISRCVRSAANAISTTFNQLQVASASATVLEATSTAVATYITIDGIIRINAAGTLIPQFTFSANPTGTITAKRNSYFELIAVGDNTLAAIGTWT